MDPVPALVIVGERVPKLGTDIDPMAVGEVWDMPRQLLGLVIAPRDVVGESGPLEGP